MDENQLLFSNSVLEELDFSDTSIKQKYDLSHKNPGTNLLMRPLHQDDFKKGFMELLGQLTEVGDTTEDMFIKRFNRMKSCSNMYYIVVIEDSEIHQIVASGTLTLELQLDSSFNFKTRGRIEDIVVSNSHRGKYLGKLLIDTLVLLAEHTSCNDLSLECKDPLVRFYSQFGFNVQEQQIYMSNRYAE